MTDAQKLAGEKLEKTTKVGADGKITNCSEDDPESFWNKKHPQGQESVKLEFGDKTIEKLNEITQKSKDTEKALEVFNHLKDRLIEKAKGLNLEIDESMIPDMDSIQKYSAFLQGIENDRSGRKEKPSGAVPLANQQIDNSEGFDSYESMMKKIRDMSNSDIPEEASEGRDLENAFWKKTIQAMKKSDKPIPTIVLNPDKLKDAINENDRGLQKTKRRLLERKGS